MADKRKSKNELRRKLARFHLAENERGIVQRFVKENGMSYLREEMDPSIFVEYVFREPVGFGLPVGQMSAVGVAVRGANDQYNVCAGTEIARKRAIRAIANQLCDVLEAFSPKGGRAYLENMREVLGIEG